MRKILLAIALCAFTPVPLKAQDYPRVELFGGYQLLHVDDSLDIEPSFGSYINGFAAACELNIKSWLGIVGELGYGRESFTESGADSDMQQMTLLVGPRFGYRAGRIRVFGHALVGHNHETAAYTYPGYFSDEITMNSFAAALGGGLDVALGNRISIRPIQLDVLFNSHSNTYGGDCQFRYAGGITIKLGSVSR